MAEKKIHIAEKFFFLNVLSPRIPAPKMLKYFSIQKGQARTEQQNRTLISMNLSKEGPI